MSSLAEKTCLRIMTYNVHGCVGTGGYCSPERIAAAIAECNPDVVALQEVDAGRKRSGRLHQANRIAELLDMNVLYHPVVERDGEYYGNAVLSRLSLHLQRTGRLPRRLSGFRPEARGGMWAEVQAGGHRLQIINAHLGLSSAERLLQARALLGPVWLDDAQQFGPTILCGDFNALPRSRPYAALCKRLFDVQAALRGRRPRPTWHSLFPILRIDHIFISGGMTVHACRVRKSLRTVVASDHLPLYADLALPVPCDIVTDS